MKGWLAWVLNQMEFEQKKDVEIPGVTLFRRQAIEAATQRYGAPVSAPGIGLAMATGFVVLLLLLAGIFLLTTSFPRKETVSGSLVPTAGLLTITSQRSGIVSKVYVEEGALVKRGDPIVRVSVESVMNGGERAGKALTNMAEGQNRALLDRERGIEASLLSQEAGARARVQGLKRQLQTLRSNVKLYEEQSLLAEQTVRDLERLVAQQIVSRLQYRDAESRALTARQNLADAQVRIADLEQERIVLQHELGRLGAERDANRANMATERLSAQEKAINYKVGTEFELVSQQDGRITSLQAKSGGTVIAGKTLGVLLPSGSPLVAEVWVPSSAIAFVNIGTEVRLMYDAFPYQKFGVARGKVSKIARSPTVPEELPLDLQSKESRYRVLLALDSQHMDAYGKSLDLTPGTRLKADLILERRSAFAWLIDPLLAASRR
jgi:membrane fusion protein